MWIQIKTNCRSKWNPTLTAGQQIDLDYDSAKILIAEGLAFEVPPQAAPASIAIQSYLAKLSQAQIAALNSGAIILPAPPAGKIYIPLFFLVKFYGGTTGWTLSAVTRFTIFGASSILSVPIPSALGQTFNDKLGASHPGVGEVATLVLFPTFVTAIAFGSTLATDAEMVLSASDGSPAPIQAETEGGNPSGGDITMGIKTFYVEEDFS